MARSLVPTLSGTTLTPPLASIPSSSADAPMNPGSLGTWRRTIAPTALDGWGSAPIQNTGAPWWCLTSPIMARASAIAGAARGPSCPSTAVLVLLALDWEGRVVGMGTSWTAFPVVGASFWTTLGRFQTHTVLRDWRATSEGFHIVAIMEGQTTTPTHCHCLGRIQTTHGIHYSTTLMAMYAMKVVEVSERVGVSITMEGIHVVELGMGMPCKTLDREKPTRNANVCVLERSPCHADTPLPMLFSGSFATASPTSLPSSRLETAKSHANTVTRSTIQPTVRVGASRVDTGATVLVKIQG